MLTPSEITFANKKVSFYEAGQGHSETVLLLHGGGLDRARLSWKHAIPRLAERLHVLAPDCPGYGETTAFEGPFTIADLGAWLIEFLDAKEVRRTHVVGISMGGALALWLAVNHPERVGRLVPVASYGLQRRASWHFLSYLISRLPILGPMFRWMGRSRRALIWTLRSMLAKGIHIDDDLIEDVRTVVRRDQAARPFHFFQRGELGWRRVTTYLLPYLAKLTHPTLFVHGDQDPLVPIKHAKRAAEVTPNAALLELKAGHWPMRELPESFNDAVSGFLVSGEVPSTGRDA